MRILKNWLGATLAGLWVAAGTGLAGSAPAPQDNIEVSGPYTFKNLAVYLIHGREKDAAPSLLTLQEALEQGKVRVVETGNVNQLTVENLSDQDVFIHSGDIVKGGRQDRVLAVDLVVPPHSGEVAIDAFCVEQGRWSQRGIEAAGSFSAADNMLPSKAARVAVRSAKDQGAVWASVRSSQAGLAEAVGTTSIASPVSDSSLQLSLENEQVEQGSAEYVEALQGVVSREADVIGYAFAVNGALDSVDIYASPALFEKLWPKLLRASAVQALMESRTTGVEPPAPAAVEAALAAASAGHPSQEQVTDRVRIGKTENAEYLLSDTYDEKHQIRLHRNLLVKQP